MIDAGGDVTLTGASEANAICDSSACNIVGGSYAQVGNGGAYSNESSEGFSETGSISVTGTSVTLNAVDDGYAQIGDGGYWAGYGLTGDAIFGDGGVPIKASPPVAMSRSMAQGKMVTRRSAMAAIR